MADNFESFESTQSTDSSSSRSALTDEALDSTSRKRTSTPTTDGKAEDKISKDFGAVEVVDEAGTKPLANSLDGSTPKPPTAADAPPSAADRPPAVGDGPPSVGDSPQAGADGRVPQIGDTKDKNGYSIISPTEQGEVINRDVPQSVASGGKGDSLKALAKDHLGPGATQEEIDAHVREIARVNGIKDPDKPLTGEKLILPGHTKDGGFVTADSDGNKRTIWHDGTVRMENADKTGYVRHPNADGTATIHTWGPKPEQNADLIKTADGKYRIADGANDKVGHEPRDAKEQLIRERQHIIDSADMKIANPDDRARFHKDMQDFEERMQKRIEDEKKRLDGEVARHTMTPERAAILKAEAQSKITNEMSETYKQTSRIFDAPDNPRLPLKAQDRAAIAEQIIHQAANPTGIDQGYHNTCNVTTIETKLYSVEPSKAAAIVADVATTGKHEITGPPAQTVEIDVNSLKPDNEARNNPPKDVERSYASQIFQVTAVNMHYARINSQSDPPGKIRYEQHEKGKSPDSGERLMDYSKNPPQRIQSKDGNGKLLDSPELNSTDLVLLEYEIRKGTFKDRYLSAHPLDTSTNQIHSEQELNDELGRLKREGKLPVTLGIHTNNYPFHQDGGESAGGKGDWHVVTVTDYEPGPPAKVSIDNQWGSKDDKNGEKALTVREVYNAMRDPSDPAHIKDLEDQLKEDKAAGKPFNMEKEIEVLRLKRRTKQLSDKELEDELERLFMEKAREIDKKIKAGTVTEADKEDYRRSMGETRDLRSNLSATQQKRLNERLIKRMKDEDIDLKRIRNF